MSSARSRPNAAPGRLARLGLGVGRALVGRRFTGTFAEMQRAQWLAPDELRARAEARLAPLLRHAVEQVPFYGELGLDPAGLRTIDDLQKLPVVDKSVFRSRPEQDFLAADVPPHRRQEYTTSGSTGDPFRFHLDRRAMPLVFASHLFYDSWYGLDPFDRCLRIMAPPADAPGMPRGTPLGSRLRQWVSSRLQSTYERFTQKRISMFDVDPERVESIWRDVEAFGPDYVLGYTSTLATLADELARRDLRLSRPIKAVITIAETLTPERRRLIENYYGAPIANRYGQREFKYWCAQSCAVDPLRFHVNTELVIWETLRDDGTRAQPGEVGRVVLTNLHNHAMPFLRYDTKDLAAVEESPCSCGRGFPRVARLDGRSQECLFTPSGRMINPTSLGHYLFVVHDYTDAVRHYQLTQLAPDAVVLRIVPAQGAGAGAELTERIRGDLGGLLGDEMQVAVEIVREIPLEPSGKRPIIKRATFDPSHGAAARS